jgi:putative flippase GtrA
MTRWLVFNAVGAGGFGLQLLTLWALLRAGLPVGAATALAVGAALSHNFAWHEAVTWRGLPRQGRWSRWRDFHAVNGIISLTTNVAVTSALAAATPMPPLVANVVAVATASVANFLVSDRYVFRAAPARYATTPVPDASGTGARAREGRSRRPI